LNDSVAHKTARYILIGVLLLLSAWMLRHFLSALAWAVVLAIATSSLYQRWLDRFSGRRRDFWAALTFTAAITIVVVAPLIYGGTIAVHEAIGLIHTVNEATRGGPPVLPDWLEKLPGIGTWLQTEWLDRFGDPETTAGTVARARPHMMQWTQFLGEQLFRRLVTLGFTLLTLFFVCLNRERLSHDVPQAAQRLFGPTVRPLLDGMVHAVRATVDGIVLVAVAEGAIMCGVYALAHAIHPILLGAVTGIFAMIPFAAPIVFAVVAIMLFLSGSLAGAITVLAAGLIVLFIADHFVRPLIIGEGASLPFLWVLLGILGGVESFGLVGLFLGPALMAALISFWRNWIRMPAAVND